MTLVINSNPGRHEALIDNIHWIGPFSTEIDLVHALLKRGIDLKTMECVSSRGVGFHCVSKWVR